VGPILTNVVTQVFAGAKRNLERERVFCSSLFPPVLVTGVQKGSDSFTAIGFMPVLQLGEGFAPRHQSYGRTFTPPISIGRA
jgi:hypothetical protein